jgi:hypothetical protein
MNDPVNSELDEYITGALCEMAAYKRLRPIIWRLQQIEGHPPFSDFIDVKSDTDGRVGMTIRENDPSEWAYCLVLTAGHPT